MPKRKNPFPENAVRGTVRTFPPSDSDAYLVGNTYTIYIASVADTITPWGTNVVKRDRELRKFWPTENMLAGAVGSVSMRNAAYEWTLEGPPKTTAAVEFFLRNALVSQGAGWIQFVLSVSTDLSTQDNGAFIEIIRRENSPTSPVIGIGHLDAGRCIRTGDIEYPVVYEDVKGNYHKLAYHQVICLSDLPSPIETMHGVGYCAVTRVLRAAQILLDLATYKHEKVSGRFTRAIHVVGGVSKKEIEDVQSRGQEDADNAGLTKFIMPMILASLDPEKPVSHVEIPLASLPDNFDLDQELKWYIAQLALGFGVDYQDFAPLPGGNLGTSTQSEILHRKSRGKGPALFMSMLKNAFYWSGVVPRNVKFAFKEQDMAAELDEARLREIRARERAIRIRSGEISPEMARQLAIESNDLEPRHLELLSEARPVDGENYIGDGQDQAGDDTMPDNLQNEITRDGYLSNA